MKTPLHSPSPLKSAEMLFVVVCPQVTLGWMALAGSHPFRNSSKRKASKTWPSQMFVWLGLKRVRKACEAVVCTVCSEFALAALKEFSFGMTMITALLTAVAREAALSATVKVPPPMLAVDCRMLAAR